MDVCIAFVVAFCSGFTEFQPESFIGRPFRGQFCFLELYEAAGLGFKELGLGFIRIRGFGAGETKNFQNTRKYEK